MSTVHPPEDAAAPPIGEQNPPPSAPPTTGADAPNATNTTPAPAEAAPPPPPTGPSGAITVFKALRDPEGTRKQVIWPSLFAVFQQPMVSDSKSTVPGYATCTFQDDKRKKENVLKCTALVLDVDNKTTSTTVDEAARVLPHYGFVCSTYNNRLEKTEPGYIGAPPRFRILYPYAQPVTPGQHARVWTWAEKQFADKGITVDPTTKDAGRFWFLPSCPPGMESVFEHRVVEGPLLDANVVAGPDETAASVEGVTYDEPLQERIARAKKYLAKMPPAVQGQDGSKACFNAACTLVRGFDLPLRTSFEMLKQEYNARCTPPWSDAELQHKVDSTTQSTRPRGYLLGGAFKQMLLLGDHVELAHRYLATLGEHAVFTQGATYQYEDGVWRPLPRSTQIASIMRFSGAPVAKKDGPAPLRLTENACNGVLALAEAQAADEGWRPCCGQAAGTPCRRPRTKSSLTGSATPTSSSSSSTRSSSSRAASTSAPRRRSRSTPRGPRPPVTRSCRRRRSVASSSPSLRRRQVPNVLVTRVTGTRRSPTLPCALRRNRNCTYPLKASARRTTSACPSCPSPSLRPRRRPRSTRPHPRRWRTC